MRQSPGLAFTALTRASHPEPTLAVTTLTTALAIAAGRGASSGLVLLAVLTGQLSIGWSNDLLDEQRDQAAGRPDKPVAAGVVSRSTVRLACTLAAVACVPLSLAAGVLAGLAHLVGVASGWAYNLWFKRTVLSPVPYAVAFGLLPAFVTLGLPGEPWPRWWVLLAGALLGMGAHFLNVVPDIAADRAAGVRGLPQRVGARTSRALGAVLLAGAAAAVTVGPGRTEVWAWAGLGVAVIAGGIAALARRGRLPFLLAIGVAALDVALLVARGSALT